MASGDISSSGRGLLPEAPTTMAMMTTGSTSAAVTTTTIWVVDLKMPAGRPEPAPGLVFAMDAPRVCS